MAAGVRRAAGVLAGGGGLILAALTFNATILLVPGLAFALLAGLTPAWVWLASRRTDVIRTLERSRVLEGEPLEVTFRIRSAWPWMRQGVIVDPLAGAIKVSSHAKLTIRFERRGRVWVDPPRLCLGDPLGLVEITVAGSGGRQEVLVLPQTDRIGWLQFRGGTSADTLRNSGDEPWGASDIDGLREYRPGTPASRIHWPALARGAGLLERRLHADTGALPLVVLDPRSDGRSEVLDAAVRAAASLVLELASQSGCELILPSARRPVRVGRDLAAWPEAHARLALVQDEGESRPLLLPRAAGPIFYVAARAPDAFRAPAFRHSRQPLVLVVPRELVGTADGPVRFTVAGCQGFLIRGGRRAAA